MCRRAQAGFAPQNADTGWLVEAAQSPALFDAELLRAPRRSTPSKTTWQRASASSVSTRSNCPGCSARSAPQAPHFALLRAHAENHWWWPPISIPRTARPFRSKCRHPARPEPVQPRSRRSIRAASRARSSRIPATTAVMAAAQRSSSTPTTLAAATQTRPRRPRMTHAVGTRARIEFKDDSCSGDSSSNSKDSSGCGSSSNSGYDGDTCTGNSATSKSSAALESGASRAAPQGPRRVRLSLLTMLAAGLSLPLRRRVK